ARPGSAAWPCSRSRRPAEAGRPAAPQRPASGGAGGQMEPVFKCHGVRETHRNDGAADEAAEGVRNVGYAVIDSDLTDEELRAVRARSEAIYARQVRECGGEDNLDRINDACIGRCLIG